MDFLVLVLVVGVVGFFVMLGLSGFAAFGMAAKDDAKVKRLEADPDATLEALFDGSPQVTYAPHDRSGGLTLPTLVKGAGERGYRMVQENGRMATRTVVFEKVASPAT